MAIDFKIDDAGWSIPIKISRSDYRPGSTTSIDFYCDDDNYDTVSGSWFGKTWLDLYAWGKKFVNNTEMKLQLSSVSFMCVPCHSGDQSYYTSSGGTVPAKGYGCDFYCDMYVVNGDNKLYAVSNVCKLEDISDYNCNSHGGPGTTCDGSSYGCSGDQYHTGFGKIKYFGPETDNHLDRNGRPRCVTERTLTFTGDNLVTIEPGGYAFILIRPDLSSWGGKDGENDAALAIQMDDSLITPVFDPAPSEYIWMCVEDEKTKKKEWKLIRKAFQFNGTEWVVMEE